MTLNVYAMAAVMAVLGIPIIIVACGSIVRELIAIRKLLERGL